MMDRTGFIDSRADAMNEWGLEKSGRWKNDTVLGADSVKDLYKQQSNQLKYSNDENDEVTFVIDEILEQVEKHVIWMKIMILGGRGKLQDEREGAM